MPRTKKEQSKGVGDTLEKVFEATGVKKLVEIFVDGKDCGCEQRKEKLNELLPYRFKARCLTEEEYNEYKDYREVRTLKMSYEQLLYICKLYASVFGRQVWIPECPECNKKTIIGMIDKLDKVFESYEN
jgi:hypothetical protein